MVVETVFRLANFLAVIGWIVLVPATLFGWKRAIDGLCGVAVPLVLAAAYVVVLASSWSGVKVDLNSVAGISALFQQPAAALAGWLHYLAFDMVVGVMLARRMQQDGVPRLVMLPVMLLTFFVGPAGFLLFHAVRLARGNLASAPPPPTKSKPARRTAGPASKA